MSIINSKPLLKKKSTRMTFLVLSCLFISKSMFSWNRDYMQVAYNKFEHSIVMRFEFFDYEYGPANEHGYIERCDFAYSTDGANYIIFMRAESDDQKHNNWTWLNMDKKLKDTDLEFNGCYDPPSATMWNDNTFMQQVKVYDIMDKANLTVKWFLDKTYLDVKAIRIIGKWHVKAISPSEYFNEVYTLPDKSVLNSDNWNDNESPSDTNGNKTKSENKDVRVYKNGDAVVVEGAVSGENINVYNNVGAQIKSNISNKEITKIKLPEKQIYIIGIGQTRYKIAL